MSRYLENDYYVISKNSIALRKDSAFDRIVRNLPDTLILRYINSVPGIPISLHRFCISNNQSVEIEELLIEVYDLDKTMNLWVRLLEHHNKDIPRICLASPVTGEFIGFTSTHAMYSITKKEIPLITYKVKRYVKSKKWRPLLSL